MRGKMKAKEKTENKTKKKNNFILYHEMYDSIEEVSDEIAGKVLKSIFLYSMNGEQPDFKKGTVESLLFKQIKNTIDINNAKYEETCERNRKHAEKRWGKEKEESIEPYVSVLFIDNSRLTKEEFEEKYTESEVSFEDLLANQMEYVEQDNIDELKERYHCKYVSNETIKKEYGLL